MSWRNLLWVDGLAGAVVGMVMLLAGDWLSAWFQLPRELLAFMGWMNLVYATYSLTLAVLKQRAKFLILLLIAANLAWSVICLRWVVIFAGTASPLGMAYLLGEGLFVAGLAGLEWRWREQLLSTDALL